MNRKRSFVAPELSHKVTVAQAVRVSDPDLAQRLAQCGPHPICDKLCLEITVRVPVAALSQLVIAEATRFDGRNVILPCLVAVEHCEPRMSSALASAANVAGLPLF